MSILLMPKIGHIIDVNALQGTTTACTAVNPSFVISSIPTHTVFYLFPASLNQTLAAYLPLFCFWCEANSFCIASCQIALY